MYGDNGLKVKFKKLVYHKIGKCINCGWVHGEVRRKRIEEITPEGKRATIVPLCLKCIEGFEQQVECNICGRTKGENLYPVSVMRKQMDEDGHTCNLFLHLCAECRKIPHDRLLKKLDVPDMCDTCEDKFKCFTAEHKKPIGSHVDRTDTKGFHKRAPLPKYKRVFKGE